MRGIDLTKIIRGALLLMENKSKREAGKKETLIPQAEKPRAETRDISDADISSVLIKSTIKIDLTKIIKRTLLIMERK